MDIPNLFKACGITIALDKSEDDKIVCFRDNGAIPSGISFLQKEHLDLQIVKLIEEIDLKEGR